MIVVVVGVVIVIVVVVVVVLEQRVEVSHVDGPSGLVGDLDGVDEPPQSVPASQVRSYRRDLPGGLELFPCRGHVEVHVHGDVSDLRLHIVVGGVE